jgi:hypothetical protein
MTSPQLLANFLPKKLSPISARVHRIEMLETTRYSLPLFYVVHDLECNLTLALVNTTYPLLEEFGSGMDGEEGREVDTAGLVYSGAK